jgi:hypothetical protein
MKSKQKTICQTIWIGKQKNFLSIIQQAMQNMKNNPAHKRIHFYHTEYDKTKVNQNDYNHKIIRTGNETSMELENEVENMIWKSHKFKQNSNSKRISPL